MTPRSSPITVINDSSDNCIDISFNIPQIVNFTLNQVLDTSGVEIVNKRGTTVDGTFVVNTTFTTLHPENYNVDICENLVEYVEMYDDESDPTKQTAIIFNEIKDYASKIKCTDFQGKGTIDDYTNLFNAASQIANETKQIELDIDVDGFTQFGEAADELSKLFQNFIIKLQNVNIINDVTFLRTIADALKKIYNLSNVFGKFKETILSTTKIQIPKTTHDTKILLEDVVDEINCAMNYIHYFVDSSESASDDAKLSDEEKNIINSATTTIENWKTICDEGVTIAMSNNSDIKYITQTSNGMINTSVNLKNATSKLKAKLAIFNC